MAEERSGASAPGATTLAGVSPRAYVALLRKRSFRALALSSLFATLGDWIGFLAIIALTQDILGYTRAAAFAVSGVMVARVVPSLLLAPVAGVFVDRWDRKKVMLVAHLGRGIVMALIPFTDEILTLILATLVIELLAVTFAPAKDAVFPTLVDRDELVLANQINLMVTYGTLPLAGFAYAALVGFANRIAPPESFLDGRPIALPIWFNALMFGVSAALIATITMVRRAGGIHHDPAVAPGPWEQFKEGFRFVGRHPVIRSLIVGVMVAAAAAGFVITTGHFFAELLNAGASGYGILVAFVGTGMLAGLVATAPLTARITPERLFAPAIGIAGAALMITASMPSLPLAVIPAFVMGAGAGVVFVVGYTVLQQRADDRIRGRTFGAFNSGVRLAIFGSTIAVPTVIGVLGRERRAFERNDEGVMELVYPYVFGGVRITLIAGGVLAVLGAVLTGRALHRALEREAEEGLVLPIEPEVVPEVTPGLFVVFEGGDGSGKSTQIRLLRSAIERAGRTSLVTREPGGTPIGERIREVLLSRGSAAMSDRTEALLYAAARAQHVDEVIRPALERGEVVLCDRYLDSSVVYQGSARGLGEEQVAELNRWGTTGLVPDLTVLLDVDPAEGLRRAASIEAPDRLEQAGLAFHREVRSAYRRLAETDPERYLVLDGTRSVEDLHATIRDVVLERLDREPGTGADQPAGGTPAATSPATAHTPAPATDPAAGQPTAPSHTEPVPQSVPATDPAAAERTRPLPREDRS
jgi:dTMP kinase